jgi:nucleoside phosphorylase
LEIGAGRDIFLHFLNRDSRQLFGIYGRLPGTAERALLEEALNVAVMLTRDAVYCPPGFLLEDPLVRTIVSEKLAFREARVLRLPVRESLDELWAKKEHEYANIRESYEGLFDAQGRKFVEENARLLVDRPFQVSSLLVSRWENAPDDKDSWSADYVRRFPAGVVDVFRRIPRVLAEEGRAVTWEAISRRVSEVATRHPSYRGLVQHIYFGLYVELLDLEVITSLPGFRTDFGLSQAKLAYSYESFVEASQAAEVWQYFLHLSDQDIVALRRTSSYFDFRGAYFALCAESSTPIELREALARGASMRSHELGKQPMAARSGQEQLPIFGLEPERLDVLATRLAIVCNGGLEAIQEQVRQSQDAQVKRRLRTMVRNPNRAKARIAIFAPLPEERKLFVAKLGLTAAKDKFFRWEGEITDATIVLYSVASMGRVPAAVATSRLFAHDSDFDALVVAGFAGGFSESETKKGDILVPSYIADLAARKIKTALDARPSRSIRPVPYTVNTELQGYLDSHFDQKAWAVIATREIDWPAGTYPVIKSGKPIVCGDEVVASDKHRSELLDAWPEASGVEMESGGVFAAADALAGKSLTRCVLRVVTDMADPSKSDDSWRRRGAETLASLIRAIDWTAVVSQERDAV